MRRVCRGNVQLKRLEGACTALSACARKQRSNRSLGRVVCCLRSDLGLSELCRMLLVGTCWVSMGVALSWKWRCCHADVRKPLVTARLRAPAPLSVVRTALLHLIAAQGQCQVSGRWPGPPGEGAAWPAVSCALSASHVGRVAEVLFGSGVCVASDDHSGAFPNPPEGSSELLLKTDFLFWCLRLQVSQEKPLWVQVHLTLAVRHEWRPHTPVPVSSPVRHCGRPHAGCFQK